MKDSKPYGYMRTADPIFTAYDRPLQFMQIYRSSEVPSFRVTTRSGNRAPLHSQHCSGSLFVISIILPPKKQRAGPL